jgi:hypothetical protein
MEKMEYKTIIENAMNMDQGDILEIASLTKNECINILSDLKREKKKYALEYGGSEVKRIVIDKMETNDKNFSIILTKVSSLNACIIKNDGTLKKLEPIKKHDDSKDEIPMLPDPELI